MAELVKSWNDGGSLSVSYEGDGDGSAVFSSDVNKGAERTMDVSFIDASRNVIVVRTVHQAAGQTPSLPYEEIDFVTFDGTLIFDTGQYGNEKTSIDIKFKRANTSANVYLYGVSTSPRLTANLAQSGYWRYGESAYPTFNTKNTNEIVAAVTPTRTKVGSYTRSYTAKSFTTKYPLPIGGHIPSSGVPTPQFVGNIYYFQMSIDGVMVADWIPVRRLSDGLECFWDKVTQTFIEPL